MRFSCALVLVVLASPAFAADSAPPPVATYLSELRRLAEQKPEDDDHLRREDSALIAKLAPVEEAVAPLIALLADDDLRVAGLAAATLRDAPRIDARYLPEVRAGLDRGLGWLAPALARMPGDAAAREAVARFLVSRGAPDNQEAYALDLLGERAIPFMVEAAACKRPCGRKDHYLLAAVLADMGPAAVSALPGLKALIVDPASPGHVAAGALQMLEAIGPAARTQSVWLVEVIETKPELATEVRSALVAIRAEEAGQIMAGQLSEQPDVYLLHDLALTGHAGRDAGPVVVGLLSHADAEIRIAAARALGFIDYRPAIGALLPLLDAPEDLRLNWVAADSLGRLQATQARAALQRIAVGHAYPPVRAAASQALRILDGEATVPAPPDDSLVGTWTYLEYQRIGQALAICERPLVETLREPKGTKLRAEEGKAALEALAYDSEILSYDAPPEEKAAAEREDRVIEVSPGNWVEHRTSVREAPTVALRVPGGWLAGSNRGEWGGEVMFIATGGKPQKVIDANVEDIYRLGDRYVAVTGIAHLTLNEGQVTELVRTADGTWSARPWRVLPGAPRASRLVEGGELLIDVLSGGSLLLSPEGKFRMAPCRD